MFAFFVVPDRRAGVAPFHVFFHLGAERKEAEFGKVRSGSNDAGRVHAEDPRIYAEAQNVFEKQVAVFDVREALFEHVAAEGVEAVKVAVTQVAFFRQGKEAVEPAAHLSGEFRIYVLRKIIGSYVFNARFRQGNIVFVKEGGEDYFAFQVIFREDAGRPEIGVGEEGDAVIVEFGDVREVKPPGVGAGVVLQFAASHDADASLAKVFHGQRRGRLFGIDLVAQPLAVPEDGNQSVGLGGKFFQDSLAFFLVRHGFHIMDAVHVLAVFQLTLRKPDFEHLLKGMSLVGLLEKMDDVKRVTFHGSRP